MCAGLYLVSNHIIYPQDKLIFCAYYLVCSLQIKSLTETSLSANQNKSEMKRMSWRVEGDTGNSVTPVRGGTVSNATLIVEMGPMEIRTFLLAF